MMMTENKLKHLGVRIPAELMEEMNDHVREDTHVTKSELTRDALRRYFENNTKRDKNDQQD